MAMNNWLAFDLMTLPMFNWWADLSVLISGTLTSTLHITVMSKSCTTAAWKILRWDAKPGETGRDQKRSASDPALILCWFVFLHLQQQSCQWPWASGLPAFIGNMWISFFSTAQQHHHYTHDSTVITGMTGFPAHIVAITVEKLMLCSVCGGQ